MLDSRSSAHIDGCRSPLFLDSAFSLTLMLLFILQTLDLFKLGEAAEHCIHVGGLLRLLLDLSSNLVDLLLQQGDGIVPLLVMGQAVSFRHGYDTHRCCGTTTGASPSASA